jgi:hypothetical protein
MHRGKLHHYRLLVIGLLFLLPHLLFAATPSSIMSQAMLTMMDAMGDLALRYRANGNWSLGSNYNPYSSLYGISGYPRNLTALPQSGYPGTVWPRGLPLQSPVPDMDGLQGVQPLASPIPQAPTSLSLLDGIWLGRGGEIVLVMYGHFRIYASAEIYRDGRFEIIGDRLIMYDLERGRHMMFHYYLEEGRMYLRNQTGDILLFKQLPIPIPPYSLFANPAPAYP